MPPPSVTPRSSGCAPNTPTRRTRPNSKESTSAGWRRNRCAVLDYFVCVMFFATSSIFCPYFYSLLCFEFQVRHCACFVLSLSLSFSALLTCLISIAPPLLILVPIFLPLLSFTLSLFTHLTLSLSFSLSLSLHLSSIPCPQLATARQHHAAELESALERCRTEAAADERRAIAAASAERAEAVAAAVEKLRAVMAAEGKLDASFFVFLHAVFSIVMIVCFQL